DVIKRYPNVSIVSCGWKEVAGNLDRVISNSLKIKVQNSLSSFTLKDFLRTPELMWTGAISMKKDLIREAGLFPSCPKCKAGGDLDTWIRTLHLSAANLHIEEVLSYYYRDTVNRVTDYNS